MGLLLIELFANPALDEILASEFEGGVNFLVTGVLGMQYPPASRGRLHHHGDEHFALDDGLMHQLVGDGHLFSRVSRPQDRAQGLRLRVGGCLLRSCHSSLLASAAAASTTPRG
jgi:hypothetical protein